jgi:PAS domain S-box-containing protein
MTDAPVDGRPPTDTEAEREGTTGHSEETERTGSEDGETTNRVRELDLGGGLSDGQDTPHVLLLLAADRNRELLAEFLAGAATVTATTDADALDGTVDLCLVDRRHLVAHRAAFAARREAVDPVWFPVVLVAPEGDALDAAVWSVADEVVRTPVSKPLLRARLRNLLARRRASSRLVEQEAALEAALADLRVRDRAMAEAPIGVTIAGAREDDTPLVYVNDAFCALTGYDRAEVVGRNCRFLQGPRTDEATVGRLREAIDAAEPVSVDLVNYTRDGEQFWNKVDIAPIHDDDGEVTHFVGFQTDITVRKLHEQRVGVLNRLVRHNLRNELNILDGYRDALARDAEVDRETALRRIDASVGRLVELSEETSHIEQVFDGHPGSVEVRPLPVVLEEVATGLRERYADVTVTVETPADPVYVNAERLSLGCLDYLSMLLDTNECATDDRRVSVVVRVDGDVVDIALTDDCGGLAESDWHVVETGVETPLRHTDRLGLWVLRWVTTTNGGELARAADGTLHVRFPVRPTPAASEHASEE